MFFDITSMQPDDLERAQDAAKDYINKQMHPADLVAVVSLDDTLSLDQDFTANKDLLLKAVNDYAGTQGAGYQPGATSTTQSGGGRQLLHAGRAGVQRPEYRPRALRASRTSRSRSTYLNEKKSLLYFSGGISARRH